MPKNEATLKQFQRYSKFYIAGADDTTSKTCWRIEATDTLSMPGVLELTAVEYYANEHEDEIDKGLVGTVEPIIEVDDTDLIQGNTFIKPKLTTEYIYIGEETSKWSFDTKLPIDVEINEKSIKITWLKTYSGQFELSYGSATKTIVVESLF